MSADVDDGAWVAQEVDSGMVDGEVCRRSILGDVR